MVESHVWERKSHGRGVMRSRDLFVYLTGKLRMRGFGKNTKISVGDEQGQEGKGLVRAVRQHGSFDGISYKKLENNASRRM